MRTIGRLAATTFPLWAASASAAEPTPACRLPPEPAAPSARRTLDAGRSADAPTLAVGTAALVRLLPTDRVAFPVPPAKPGPGTHGGVLAFDVVRPGRHRVAMGAKARIEVVRDGRAVPSAAHGHGSACAGVAKQVDFDLRPGRHFLEISGALGASAGVIVAYLP